MAKLYYRRNVFLLSHSRCLSNSPKLIENYNRDMAAYFRGSMDFIVIQTSKLPLRTQLIEFPSNPIRAMNALITRNIRPQFDKTVTKSDSVSIVATCYVPSGSKCIRFK